MKYISLVVLLYLIHSCSSVSGIEAVVVKDCTGSYIRLQEEDYYVCNKELLKTYADGDSIRVRFTKVDQCENPDTSIVCMMYHPFVGRVKLKKVNPSGSK